jgi:predicted alpha/beta-hydrolase family hydrolase
VARDVVVAKDVVVAVETPVGPAECVLRRPIGKPRGILLVGHGAGGDIEAPDIVALTSSAVAGGLAVGRVRQPYRVAGRRAPAPAAQLDVAWTAVAAAVQVSRLIPGARVLPLAVAGRSSGARVACRTASEVGAVAVLALAFPLHPPGRPDRSRAAELEVAVPLRVVQGSRDAFGRPADFPPGVDVAAVEGADHGLKAPGAAVVLAAAVGWLLDQLEPAAVSAARSGIDAPKAAL